MSAPTLKETIASDIPDVFMNTDEFAELVTYQQGAGAAVTVSAIAHEVKYQVTDQEGFASSVVSTDFSIPMDSLAIRPRAGDRITRTVGAETYIYSAAPVSNTQPAVEQDESNHLWLVHTKRIN